jgi:hypothetical protein
MVSHSSIAARLYKIERQRVATSRDSATKRTNSEAPRLDKLRALPPPNQNRGEIAEFLTYETTCTSEILEKTTCEIFCYRQAPAANGSAGTLPPADAIGAKRTCRQWEWRQVGRWRQEDMPHDANGGRGLVHFTRTGGLMRSKIQNRIKPVATYVYRESTDNHLIDQPHRARTCTSLPTYV